MAELVLGALGVVPLLGFAISSYRELSHGLKTFRRSSSTVQRLRKLLGVQYRVFENECKLLLRDCLHDDVVELMVADLESDSWNSSEVEADVERSLKDNYENCVHLIEDIIQSVGHLQEELNKFTDPTKPPSKVVEVE
jgi:hypothetical protein